VVFLHGVLSVMSLSTAALSLWKPAYAGISSIASMLSDTLKGTVGVIIRRHHCLVNLTLPLLFKTYIKTEYKVILCVFIYMFEILTL
jgi:hypothetical protein